MIHIDMDELKARGSKYLISAELTALIIELDNNGALLPVLSRIVAEARKIEKEAQKAAMVSGLFGDIFKGDLTDEIREDTEA